MTADRTFTCRTSRRTVLMGAGAIVAGTSAARALPQPTVDAMRIASPASDLHSVFHTPPAEAKPNLFWYWLNNVVTREGITADLTAMAEAGFGRAVLFTIGIGGENPGGHVYPSLTPDWWDMLGFAITEAERVGMEITVGVCDGWATAGGPWITPELSMQRLVSSEAWTGGSGPIILPQPPTTADHYRDIRVVAFKLPAGWDTSVERGAKLTTSFALKRPAMLHTHRASTTSLKTASEGWIQFEFQAPFSVSDVVAEGPDGRGEGAGLILMSSDDGVAFKPVGRLAQPLERAHSETGRAPAAPPADISTRYALDSGRTAPARFYRIVYDKAAEAKPGGSTFAGPNGDPAVKAAPAELALNRLVLVDEPVLPDLSARTARAWSLPPQDLGDADIPAAACLSPDQIVDVTQHLGADNTLNWTPPKPGVWKIVRIGHTPTGAINSTGFPAGRGLECDKLSAAAARIQFDGWLGGFVKRGLKRKDGALTTMHVDSWECATQTWSPVLPDEFAKRRGYDMLPYLPILAGVPVGDAETINRMLSDFRRTIGECAAENFWGEMSRLGSAAGYRFSGEPANPVFPTDALIYAKYIERPMGEFWVYGDDKPSDVAEAIHGSHVYGRRLVGAEAFTEFAMEWNETPYSCKSLGDANWAKGINQLTCHVWAAQPWADPQHAPGMTLANIGVFFSRTNTWWPMSKPWFDYMRRSQALLQQGRPVTDIACYIGEEIPSRAYVPSNTPLPVPAGYAFDSINADALLNLATVRDGWLTLPSGQRYAALLLPKSWRCTVTMLERIDALARAGATIVGAPPSGPIGLEGGKAGRERITALTTALWGTTPDLHRHGGGRIGTTNDLASVLSGASVIPDCRIVAPVTPADTISPIMWTHREGRDWHLYFFSNQSDRAQQVTATLRVAGQRASLWNADTGTIHAVAQQPADGGTSVTFALEPCGAAFIIFEGNSVAVEPDWKGAAAPQALGGTWQVTFERGLAAPQAVTMPRLQSWTTLEPEALRFYSGTATYETDLEIRQAGRWRLDLGEVSEVCEVEVNGKHVRTLWKPPFVIDLDKELRVGRNRLVVRVANTWRNRLVGDGLKPQAERTSFTVTPFFSPEAEKSALGHAKQVRAFDAEGYYLGGGWTNEQRGVPLRQTPAGTPFPTRKGASRFGFAGGGSTAPYPDMRRKPDGQGLIVAGLLGPVTMQRLVRS